MISIPRKYGPARLPVRPVGKYGPARLPVRPVAEWSRGFSFTKRKGTIGNEPRVINRLRVINSLIEEKGRGKEKFPLHPFKRKGEGKRASDRRLWASIAWRVGVENFHYALADKLKEDDVDKAVLLTPAAAFQAFLNERFPKPGEKGGRA